MPVCTFMCPQFDIGLWYRDEKNLVTWSGSWGVRRNCAFKIMVIFFSQMRGGGIRPPNYNFFVFASMSTSFVKIM